MNRLAKNFISAALSTGAIPLAMGLGASAVLAAEGLPDDPAEWVCDGSDRPATSAEIEAWCEAGKGRGAPLPFSPKPSFLTDLSAKNAFDGALRGFLRAGGYRDWVHDERWRLTGPYLGEIGAGKSYGVHPLVRIYYSPEMVEWLCAGRPDRIPDGATIIKEMHEIDAESVEVVEGCMRATDRTDDPAFRPGSWTVMVRANGATADGWYWANPAGKGDGTRRFSTSPRSSRRPFSTAFPNAIRAGIRPATSSAARSRAARTWPTQSIPTACSAPIA